MEAEVEEFFDFPDRPWLPIFWFLARLSQMASSLTSTEEWRGLYLPKSPPMCDPSCFRLGKFSHSRVRFFGRRVSATHFPQCLRLEVGEIAMIWAYNEVFGNCSFQRGERSNFLMGR